MIGRKKREKPGRNSRVDDGFSGLASPAQRNYYERETVSIWVELADAFESVKE